MLAGPHEKLGGGDRGSAVRGRQRRKACEDRRRGRLRRSRCQVQEALHVH
ncbi:MAG: hypothetical protein MZU97_27230 [Bacillus subtilis]|nr:hypothetical protein [Bacillus subtilis]